MRQHLHHRAIGYFDAVRRHGSIREAARRLSIAPSAINRHILKLEADIGMPLFERLPDGMTLTPAGEVVARHAILVLQDEQRAIGELQALQGLKRGEVSLVAVESLSTAFLPDVIARMGTKYPAIQFKAGLAGSTLVPAIVAAGDADLGLAFSLPRHPDLQQLAVGRFRLRAVMPPDHPLAKAPKVSFADCAQYKLILPRADLSLFNLLEPHIRRFKARCEVVAEVSSLELMKHLSARLGAISFQARFGLEGTGPARDLVQVPLYAGGPITTELGVYARQGRSLPVAVTAFIALLGDELARLETEDAIS